MKIHQHNAGYMSKMAVMPIKSKKIFFPGTTELIFGESMYGASNTLALYILFKL